MFQDFPNKEYMLERMGIQRQQDAVETVTNTLFDYANLVQQGMDPNNAILQTADMMNQRRQGQEPSGEIPPELMGNDVTQMPIE
jgi:hypothetical protein